MATYNGNSQSGLINLLKTMGIVNSDQYYNPSTDSYGAVTSNTENPYSMSTSSQNSPSVTTPSYASLGMQGLQTLSNLGSAYTAYKNLGLAEDEFDFNKGLAETNLANQASLINEDRLNSANVGLSLAGSTLSDSQKDAVRNKIKSNNVSGTI